MSLSRNAVYRPLGCREERDELTKELAEPSTTDEMDSIMHFLEGF